MAVVEAAVAGHGHATPSWSLGARLQVYLEGTPRPASTTAETGILSPLACTNVEHEMPPARRVSRRAHRGV